MLKLFYAAPIAAVLMASYVSAAESVTQQPAHVEIDPMKGCYAADKFYSEGMPLETSQGVFICKHSANDYGNRNNSLPFEWVKQQ